MVEEVEVEDDGVDKWRNYDTHPYIVLDSESDVSVINSGDFNENSISIDSNNIYEKSNRLVNFINENNQDGNYNIIIIIIINININFIPNRQKYIYLFLKYNPYIYIYIYTKKIFP